MVIVVTQRDTMSGFVDFTAQPKRDLKPILTETYGTSWEKCSEEKQMVLRAKEGLLNK